MGAFVFSELAKKTPIGGTIMQLFYHFEKKDPQKVIEGARHAYGIKNPDRINGFTGAFLVYWKDVYITDRVAKKANAYKWFTDFLNDCISRFLYDDYGFVTESEQWNNTETRWLGGSSDWMIARYSCKELTTGVVFASLYDISLISFMEEDVSAIYEEQFRKCPYSKGSIDKWFLNELRYVHGQLN